MAVLTLDVEFDFEYDLIGIISDVKEYKVAWLVNKVMELQLEKHEDLEFLMPGKKKLLISNFSEEREHCTVRLLRNKAYVDNGISKPFLLPEMKNYDYFIQIDGEYSLMSVDELKIELRKYPMIQYADRIDVNTLKSKENLVY